VKHFVWPIAETVVCPSQSTGKNSSTLLVVTTVYGRRGRGETIMIEPFVETLAITISNIIQNLGAALYKIIIYLRGLVAYEDGRPNGLGRCLLIKVAVMVFFLFYTILLCRLIKLQRRLQLVTAYVSIYYYRKQFN